MNPYRGRRRTPEEWSALERGWAAIVRAYEADPEAGDRAAKKFSDELERNVEHLIASMEALKAQQDNQGDS